MNEEARYIDILKRYGEVIDKIIDMRFSAIICPVRKSYNTYETYCRVYHNGMWTPENIFLCSDVFLHTAEAEHVFKEIIEQNGKIAVLEEAVWIGRGAKRVVDTLDLRLGVKRENIEVFALAKFANFINVLEAEKLSYEDIDEFSDRILTICYENSVPYTHCLPKTRIIEVTTDEEIDHYYNMLKSGGLLGFEEDFPDKMCEMGSGYFIRNITDNELNETLGSCFAKIIDYAYLEAYFFTHRNEFVFVPRICLRKLSKDNINLLWKLMLETFRKTNDTRFNKLEHYIVTENIFTKFAIIEYIIALRINRIFVYNNGVEYKVDSDHLVRHYGKMCDEAISPLVDYEWDLLDFISIDNDIIYEETPDSVKINSADADSIPQLFFNEIVDERISICKLIPDAKNANMNLDDLPTGEYTLNALVSVYGREHLHKTYAKMLVDGKVTSRMKYDDVAKNVFEITHVGECAVCESINFLPIYHSLSLAMTRKPEFLGESDGAIMKRYQLYHTVAEALVKRGYPAFNKYLSRFNKVPKDATLLQVTKVIDAFRNNIISHSNKYSVCTDEPLDKYDDIVLGVINEDYTEFVMK